MQTFHQYAFDYTEENLLTDIEKLREMFENKFQSNQKVINSILDKIYEEDEPSLELDAALRMEIDRFEVVVDVAQNDTTCLESLFTPNDRLHNIVKWLANNGNNPEQWNEGAERRRVEIMKKLGHG